MGLSLEPHFSSLRTDSLIPMWSYMWEKQLEGPLAVPWEQGAGSCTFRSVLPSTQQSESLADSRPSARPAYTDTASPQLPNQDSETEAGVKNSTDTMFAKAWQGTWKGKAYREAKAGRPGVYMAWQSWVAAAQHKPTVLPDKQEPTHHSSSPLRYTQEFLLFGIISKSCQLIRNQKS